MAFPTWSKHFSLATAGVVVVALGLGAASAPSQTARSAAVQTLSVSIVNQGGLDGDAPWGHVNSSPPGIDCPPTCSAPYPAGTVVELSPDPAPGYSLAGWNAFPNDPGCEQGQTCSLTISDSQFAPSVQASFQPAAELQAMTAGPGSLSITPVQPGATAVCKVDGQQEDPDSTCIQRYRTGTPVTLTANPDAGGAHLVGWSDYGCAASSRTCTLTLAAGTRYITARFGPVKLTIQGGAFGSVVVKPAPGGTCTFTEGAPPCEFTYPSGTIVTMRRQHGAPGNFWIGGCDGNTGGTLDADVCRLRLHGNELVGAGLEDVTAIPPPRGSGLVVRRDGNGRGKVTGRVLNGNGTLNCGSLCSISGLTRYDQILLTATRAKGSRFVRWSDGNTISTRVIRLSRFNRIKATFAKGSRGR
jgi:Divergent InlB B-repeat domain